MTPYKKGTTMSIKTMAIKINAKNYSLVTACLPVGFLAVPPEKAFDCYLVINEIKPVKGRTVADDRVIVENSWYGEADFAAFYDGLEPPDDYGFFEVRQREAR